MGVYIANVEREAVKTLFVEYITSKYCLHVALIKAILENVELKLVLKDEILWVWHAVVMGSLHGYSIHITGTTIYESSPFKNKLLLSIYNYKISQLAIGYS